MTDSDRVIPMILCTTFVHDDDDDDDDGDDDGVDDDDDGDTLRTEMFQMNPNEPRLKLFKRLC